MRKEEKREKMMNDGERGVLPLVMGARENKGDNSD